jgi:hypothetical protein
MEVQEAEVWPATRLHGPTGGASGYCE